MARLQNPPDAGGAIERMRRTISRAGLVLVLAGLAISIGLWMSGNQGPAARVFTMTAALLVIMPTVGVMAVLAEETKRRDWAFAGIAAGVLLLIAYIVYDLARN